jgi:hypothetical protein
VVLYKPLSYARGGTNGTLADATATTYTPGGSYRVLQADGTLGPVVTSVSLRNGEGAILIKVSSGQTATATASPTTLAAPALTDVTARVRLRVRRLPRRKRLGFSRQQVTIANVSGASLRGPLWLVLTNLDPSVLLVRRRPAPGSPGRNLVPVGVSQLYPRQSVTVTLTFSSPLGRPVRFGARVMDGVL